MERFEQRRRVQDCQAINPGQAIKTPRARETYFPDVEMESVGSRQVQSDFVDPGGHIPYESERENSMRPSMAPESFDNSGPSPQHIRFSVIGDLKKLNGRYLDDNAPETGSARPTRRS